VPATRGPMDRDDAPPSPRIHSIAGCPVHRVEIRKRLSKFSWWLPAFCVQRVACGPTKGQERRAFFQDRYKANPVADEASLLGVRP